MRRVLEGLLRKQKAFQRMPSLCILWLAAAFWLVVSTDFQQYETAQSL